jgi:microsomal dipeptidase-like Zn-dependent dipeptidase
MGQNTKLIIDLHTHLETLNPAVSFRNKIQGHLYSIKGHINKDYKVVLSTAMYVQYWNNYNDLKNMTSEFIKVINEFGGDVKLIKNAQDLNSEYKVGIILHVESARCLDDYKNQIPELYKLGVRGIIPIHFIDNQFGNSSDDPRRRLKLRTKDLGITQKGKDLISLCNDLKMWIDLSHTTDITGFQMMELANEVMVSHVGIRNLVNRVRNKEIKFLQAVSKKNGIFGLTPWSHLVGDSVESFKEQIQYATNNDLGSAICIGTDLGAPIKTNQKIKSIFDIDNLIDNDSFIYKNAWEFFNRVL